MSDVDEIRRLCEMLSLGWQERVEYGVTRGKQIEKRARGVPQEPIADQLARHIEKPTRVAYDTNTGGSAGTRVDAPAPAGIEAALLLDEIRRAMYDLVMRSRAMLGYSDPKPMTFANVSCPDCHSALIHHSDGEVMCTACPLIWRREDWLRLL